MNTHANHTHIPHGAHYGSVTSYVLGFGISCVFTVVAFALVQDHILSAHTILPHSFLIPAIIALAVTQFFVQLVCFLHLGRESSPRWKLIIFSYAAVLLLALVIGTIWIMDNLNYNMMMSPQEMDAYMLDQ